MSGVTISFAPEEFGILADQAEDRVEEAGGDWSEYTESVEIDGDESNLTARAAGDMAALLVHEHFDVGDDLDGRLSADENGMNVHLDVAEDQEEALVEIGHERIEKRHASSPGRPNPPYVETMKSRIEAEDVARAIVHGAVEEEREGS